MGRPLVELTVTAQDRRQLGVDCPIAESAGGVVERG
jgi:hypothetical protein